MTSIKPTHVERAGLIDVVNVERRAFVARLAGHLATVRTLSFSPDGQQLASGSEDRDIRLWSTRAWDLVGLRRDHSGTVLGLDFSRDSRQLVSASVDGTVRVSDVDRYDQAMIDEILGESTNVRTCETTMRTVPVMPFPSADLVWAPASQCLDVGESEERLIAGSPGLQGDRSAGAPESHARSGGPLP